MKGTKNQVSCSVIKRVPMGLTAGSHHGLCPWPSGCPLLCPLSHALSSSPAPSSPAPSSLCASLLSQALLLWGRGCPRKPLDWPARWGREPGPARWHLGAGSPQSSIELSCQLAEENCERREAFWAEWKDLTLSTRPEEGCSLHEEDAQRHETYHRQGQCQALVQRSPWLVMRMGILGRGLQEYQLPYQRVLPLPIFTPAKVGASKEEREETPIQLRELLALETALGGQCVDRQDVAEITKQLPPVVPVSKPGTLRRSLSRSMSQEAQRG